MNLAEMIHTICVVIYCSFWVLASCLGIGIVALFAWAFAGTLGLIWSSFT